MSNDNNLPFKKSWAGQDDKIHEPKASWSVGNFELIQSDKQAINNKHKTTPIEREKSVESISLSHKWLMIHYLLKC